MKLVIATLKRNEAKLCYFVAFSMMIGVIFTLIQSGVIANLMSFTFNLEGIKPQTEIAPLATAENSPSEGKNASAESSPSPPPSLAQAIVQTFLLIKNEGNLSATKYVVESESLALMLSLGGIVFLSIALTQFLFFLKDFLIHILSVRLMAHLRRELFEKFMTLPSQTFREQESGDLISRTLIDVERIGLQLREFLEGVVYGTILSIVGFIAMFYLNLELSLILFASAIVLVVLIQISGSMLRRIVQRLQERIADISTRLQEAIYAIDVIKIFTREKWEIQRFRKFVSNYLQLASREALIFQLIRPITEVIGILGIIVVFLYAASLIWQNTLALEDLVNFLIILMYVIPYLQRLTRAFFIKEQIEASAARVQALLHLQGEATRKGAYESLKNFTGKLRVENLFFAHQPFLPKNSNLPNHHTGKKSIKKSKGEKANVNKNFRKTPSLPTTARETQIIHGINFRVEAGQMVALVGPSGSGKSTLISLIASLLNPSKGKILYDEIPYDKLSIFDIRRHIALVTQENILLSASLMENIRYGKLEASDEEVLNAAKQAHLDELIDKLEHGLQTQLGERGAMLSGGERQRVAIARAIIKQPKILLLDEATSSLDTHSERIIQLTIESIAKNRTTIVVAHRLSTVLKADKILVIEKGKLVEEGSHLQLLAQNGLYKTLYDLQFSSGGT